MKKSIFLWILILFFPLKFVCASLSINEIMYAPAAGSDYEWVEIFNSGTSSVDLNNYRFFHGTNETSSNSGPLTLRNGSTTVLQPSEYAIITKSQSSYTWLNFSGMILSASTVSLPDTGDNTYIAISDQNKVILDFIKYDTSLGGSKDSGNSLQKISGSWQAKSPTPGAANEALSTSANTSNGASNSGSGSSSDSSAPPAPAAQSKKPPESKIRTNIIASALDFVGIPATFEARASGKAGETLYDGKYFWNFGDGDSTEVRVNEAQSVTHTYFYPGEYHVSLEYYSSYYATVSDASDTVTIKVVPADVSISRVGDQTDFFVELANNTDYDTDISNWVLASDTKSFMIPRNTTIASKDKMIISARVTHFSVFDKDSLKLMTSQGALVFDYGAEQVTPQSPLPARNAFSIADAGGPNPLLNKERRSPENSPLPNPPQRGGLSLSLGEGGGEVYSEVSKKPSVKENPIVLEKSTDVPVQTASAVSSDVVKDNPMRTYMLTTVLTVFLGLAAGSVYFIRRKRVVPKPGDDFKILDE